MEMLSIRLELMLIFLLEGGVLLALAQHTILHHQEFYIIAHEAPERVLWGTDNRLTAHIEAGVDKYCAAGLCFEP
jgi:hypothetical protein